MVAQHIVRPQSMFGIQRFPIQNCLNKFGWVKTAPHELEVEGRMQFVLASIADDFFSGVNEGLAHRVTFRI